MRKFLIIILSVMFVFLSFGCTAEKSQEERLSASQQNYADIVYSHKNIWENHPSRDLTCQYISMFKYNGRAYLQCSYGRAAFPDDVSFDDYKNNSAVSQICVIYEISEGMPESSVNNYGFVSMTRYAVSADNQSKQKAIEKAALSL